MFPTIKFWFSYLIIFLFIEECGLEFSTPGVCLRLIFLFIAALATNPDERVGQIPME